MQPVADADRLDQLRRVRRHRQRVDALVPRVRRREDRALRAALGSARAQRAAAPRRRAARAARRPAPKQRASSLELGRRAVTVTLVPSPSRLESVIVPPCCSTSAREIASPRPGARNRTPASPSTRGRSARRPGPARRAGTPMPVSATTSRTRVAVAVDASPSRGRPRRVNFTAFETRLSITCVEPARVAAHRRRMVGDELERDALLVGGRARRPRPRATRAPRRRPARAQLDPLRLDLRDQQQVLDERVQPLGAAADHVEVLAPARRRARASSSCIISRKPEIDVSGVRSSCETVATNASRIRSSSRSAVTSRSVQMRPREAAVDLGHRCRVAAEHATGARDLELVGRRRARRARRARASASGSAPARPSCRRSRAAARARCRACGMPSSSDEPPQRLVRDQDVAVARR